MRLSDHARMPSIAAVMTPFPYWVDASETIDTVEETLRAHDIHHLPVKQDGELVGIISSRDLGHLVHPALPSRDRHRIHARQLMRRELYTVTPEHRLAPVLREMARLRVGTALVTRGDQLVGILTLVDVCELLAESLEQRFGPDDAA